MDKPVKLISFNCKSVSTSVDCIRRLCDAADIIALQETWLLPHDLAFLGNIHNDFAFTGNSAVDTTAGVLRGRPYGGVALLWRKSLFSMVSVIQCSSVRIAAVKVRLCDRDMLVFSVYMPTNSSDNLTEFTDCLSEIAAIIDSNNIETVFMLGDYNAHIGELFHSELLKICEEQHWSCADIECLPSDSYTYVSDSHGCRRWLDHCITTAAARQTLVNVKVLYDVYWSDHMPIEVECNLKLITPNIVMPKPNCNNIVWGLRDSSQISVYEEMCNAGLRGIDFPHEFGRCADTHCKNVNHKVVLDDLYNNIICILQQSAVCSSAANKPRTYKPVPGWNKHVKIAYKEARLAFQGWQLCGKPDTGVEYNKMSNTRRIYKSNLKWCRNNEKQIKLHLISENHKSKDFGNFWKNTNKLSPRLSLPVSVGGKHDPSQIANMFVDQFKVKPLANPTVDHVTQTVTDADVSMKLGVFFSTKAVVKVIKNMIRGKSPGHDHLSVEHLRYAGIHLPRVLSMFFRLCINHCYLPSALMRTIVVPIMKNKTGDAADPANYRPISLATVIAKVLDSLLDTYMAPRISLHDAQFGFRPGLSTESAIMCLKRTIRYYTDRKTPVNACFLDLSRAFDLVSYDLLWGKLRNEEKLETEVISVLKFWYENQVNNVRWAGTLSEEYRLECGVRQGGITSPRLFNVYINQLIVELSNTGIGCHVGGVAMNNISYADDMVLLSPSISALRRLLKICEDYAMTQGLRYNVAKSELLVFNVGAKRDLNVPCISLAGKPLKRVSKFKYLGHWVTDDLCDDLDIERERRALSVRSNMLARRFARCTCEVKMTLFRAYCQTFYTCSLWVKYTQKAYSALRVQYNNAFRMLVGLPRFCSASGMFADARVDDFYAIIRKRCASLRQRTCFSSHTMLRALSDRWDCPMLGRWVRLHTQVSSK